MPEGIHHEHARLAESLARVRMVARVLRADGVVDPDGYREVRRFIDEVALPHLRHEEDEIFPLAAERGMPVQVLDFLRRDHEQLRFLARLAKVMGLRAGVTVLPVDAAETIDRFVRAFDEHARHEEALFLELERENEALAG